LLLLLQLLLGLIEKEKKKIIENCTEGRITHDVMAGRVSDRQHFDIIQKKKKKESQMIVNKSTFFYHDREKKRRKENRIRDDGVGLIKGGAPPIQVV
jgi:hypothetical protein